MSINRILFISIFLFLFCTSFIVNGNEIEQEEEEEGGSRMINNQDEIQYEGDENQIELELNDYEAEDSSLSSPPISDSQSLLELDSTIDIDPLPPISIQQSPSTTTPNGLTPAGSTPAGNQDMSELGMCEVCMYVLENKQQHQPYLCKGLKDSHYQSICVQVMESLLWWISNEVYWVNYGCQMNQNGAISWVRPCPAHAICSWIQHLYLRKPFCTEDKNFPKPA